MHTLDTVIMRLSVYGTLRLGTAQYDLYRDTRWKNDLYQKLAPKEVIILKSDNKLGTSLLAPNRTLRLYSVKVSGIQVTFKHSRPIKRPNFGQIYYVRIQC